MHQPEITCIITCINMSLFYPYCTYSLNVKAGSLSPKHCIASTIIFHKFSVLIYVWILKNIGRELQETLCCVALLLVCSFEIIHSTNYNWQLVTLPPSSYVINTPIWFMLIAVKIKGKYFPCQVINVIARNWRNIIKRLSVSA